MTAKATQVDVIIVGAGLAGLTLASLLAKQGKSLAIIDRVLPSEFDRETPYDIRVTAVSPGSRAIFEHIGVWPDVQAKRVSEFDAMVVWDEASSAKIRFVAREVRQPVLGYIVENRVIQSSLHESLLGVSDIHWCVPESVTDIVHCDDVVEVILENKQVLRAKLLVGADGSRSGIRGLAEISHAEKLYLQQGIVANVQTEFSHQRTAWQRFLKTGPLALLPIGADKENRECSIVWSADHGYAKQLMQMGEEEFSQEITKASDSRLGNIRLISERVCFPLVSGQAKDLVKPRIALVGDAAHTLHPLAGQGANLGLTDVAVLADVLENTERDMGSLRVLRKYERARAGEIQVMQFAMDAFVAVFGSSSKPVVTARSIALDMAAQTPSMKRFFMEHAMGLSRDRPVFAR
ncbi:MAG: UbiH/UbiF/VisC/COQ6 family ubiquinone biosynthesis hydroxylase [Gammaproteobacteria bacterium]|nr:UbiH/UbiF/VisC/COQ6 family ubiquinone biosynthesis hydroxylase [Gammaproteobacteria bacterium]